MSTNIKTSNNILTIKSKQYNNLWMSKAIDFRIIHISLLATPFFHSNLKCQAFTNDVCRPEHFAHPTKWTILYENKKKIVWKPESSESYQKTRSSLFIAICMYSLLLHLLILLDIFCCIVASSDLFSRSERQMDKL